MRAMPAIEIHCPIELLYDAGLLPTAFALSEARRIEQHRPDLARHIARGEEITVQAQNGQLISFSQRHEAFYAQ